MSDNRPNLFDYATSELSQDAFICWLVQWAHPRYRDTEAAMHRIGVQFFEKVFLEKGGRKCPEIKTIHIRRQYCHADVVVFINKENQEDLHVVIIEDKTFTSDSPDQLKRYANRIRESVHNEYPGWNSENIIGVYYKIWDQGNYKSVKEAEYVNLRRSNIIDILKSDPFARNGNIILDDYLRRLETIEAEVGAFESMTLADWDDRSNWWRRYAAWTGFYCKLQKELSNNSDWGYVNNQSGGFLGLWWCWAPFSGYHVYLQLQEEKLCFRVEWNAADNIDVSVIESATRALIAKAHAISQRIAGGAITPAKYIKYKKNNKAFMEWNGYRVADQNGKLDFKRTLDNIGLAEKVLVELQKEMESPQESE